MLKKLSLFLILVLADQSVKFMAQNGLLSPARGFLVYVCNPYISWGIPISGGFFWLAWLISNGLLVYFILRYNKNIWLFVVLGGSFSNVVDRLLHGCVVDYFRLPLGNFPIFNLADAFIVVGIGMFLINDIFYKKRIYTPSL